MRNFGWLAACVSVVGLFALGLGDAEAQRQPPYYASISASEARMRTGPGRNYPASWFYRRADLPIRVIARYQDWRKIEDPDGTQGWMQVGLLSDTRTGMVVGVIAEMRSSPDFDAHVNYRAEPGVVGRISKCARGWCWFDVRGRAGYVEQSKLWGTDPGEQVQ
ncbi:MAG: hypothetical protein CMN73_01860 [Sphingomonas sp.]|nr:hypothetical protein [Sphingomonas sp.]